MYFPCRPVNYTLAVQCVRLTNTNINTNITKPLQHFIDLLFPIIIIIITTTFTVTQEQFTRFTRLLCCTIHLRFELLYKPAHNPLHVCSLDLLYAL